MQLRNFLLTVLAFGLAACDKGEVANQEIKPAHPVEVAIRASHSAMGRTALGDVPSGVQSGTEQPIEWSVGDKIGVWAKADGESAYAVNGAVFTLSTYNDTYDDADFMATIDPMAAGTYSYYAVYPQPLSQSGTTVSYTLPSQQSGAYDPALDVMAATATGNALVSREDDSSANVAWQEPRLSFEHLFHMIRIRIPEGKNLLGQPIKRLDIVFPQDVVGTASFDVTNPSQITWSNLSNKITVEIPNKGNYIDEDSNYVWLHIKPGTLNGTISFQAYDSYGVPSTVISTNINKSVESQRVTPIALTIPQSAYDVTYLDFTVYKNNLGEPLENISLSGLTFVDADAYSQTSTISLLSDENPQIFKVAVVGAPSSVQNSNVTITYQSQHAKIEGRSIPLTTAITKFEDTSINVLPSNLVAVNSNTVNMVVPYLYFEDFSGVTSTTDNNYEDWQWSESSGTHLASEISALPGWTGARWQLQNGSISVSAYYGAAIGTGSIAFGRLDSSPMVNITKQCNTIVRFDHEGSVTTDNLSASCYFGTSTTSGLINGGANRNYTYPETYDSANGVFSVVTSSKLTKTYNISECTSATRLSWCNNITSTGHTRRYAYLHISNIKVSIVN